MKDKENKTKLVGETGVAPATSRSQTERSTDELLPECRGRDSNPHNGDPSRDFKSLASTNSATSAKVNQTMFL
mgnify:CR=1 FL=1